MLLKIHTKLSDVKKTAEAYIFTVSHSTETRPISVELRWKMGQWEEREGRFFY